MTDSKSRLLETLEIYMDLAEKQDAVIFHLSAIVRSQEEQIQNMENMLEFEAYPEQPWLTDSKREAKEALVEYNLAKGSFGI